MLSRPGTVLALIGAPAVGAVAGGAAVSLATPGSAAMLGVSYFLFGSIFSYAAALLVGMPALMLLRNRTSHMAICFIGIAIVSALLISAAVQSLLTHALAFPPARTAIFAVVCGGVTATLILRIHREANAD